MGVYSRNTWPWPYGLPWRHWPPPPPDCGSLCWLSLPWYLVYPGWHRGDLEEEHNLRSYSGSTSRQISDIYKIGVWKSHETISFYFILFTLDLLGLSSALFCLVSVDYLEISAIGYLGCMQLQKAVRINNVNFEFSIHHSKMKLHIPLAYISSKLLLGLYKKIRTTLLSHKGNLSWAPSPCITLAITCYQCHNVHIQNRS